ncbi:MAG TPA: hypothetical protein VK970_17350, partial [Candidatus Methylacidiphilales bacterium]|nr:hypothetical protein [Candidatus Methylacidiphilales bacterium]
LFATLDRPRKALELAYQLKKLLTPPLSERTIYCLRVTPAGAADFDKGLEELMKPVDKIIATLTDMVKLIGG